MSQYIQKISFLLIKKQTFCQTSFFGRLKCIFENHVRKVFDKKPIFSRSVTEYEKRNKNSFKIDFSPENDPIDFENAVLWQHCRIVFAIRAQFFRSMSKTVWENKFFREQSMFSSRILLDTWNAVLATLLNFSDQRPIFYYPRNGNEKKILTKNVSSKCYSGHLESRMHVLTTLPNALPWWAEQFSLNVRNWLKKPFFFQRKTFSLESLWGKLDGTSDNSAGKKLHLPQFFYSTSKRDWKTF